MSSCAGAAAFRFGELMANFFLRDIDPVIFAEARGYCVQRGLRFPDVVTELVKAWNMEQRAKQLKANGPPEFKKTKAAARGKD